MQIGGNRLLFVSIYVDELCSKKVTKHIMLHFSSFNAKVGYLAMRCINFSANLIWFAIILFIGN